MMGITELAPAKLNLTLDVGARRPDGYHDITSIMQSAALYDVVALDFSEAGGIAIECPGTDLPTGPDNLAWKAADVFFRETNISRTGISIRLEKKIPSQAGLGGGSRRAAGNASFVSRGCVRQVVRSHGRPGGQRCSLLHPGRYGSGPGPGRTAYRSSGTAYVLVRYREAPGGQLYRRHVSEAGRNFHLWTPRFR